MRIYKGKYYVAIRFSNDLCVGVGNPPKDFLANAVLDRPHRPKKLFRRVEY